MTGSLQKKQTTERYGKKMDSIKVSALYNTEETIAKELFKDDCYPWEILPKIKDFIDGLVEEARKTGYAVTLFGRRRPIPELSSNNFMQRSFGERIAMNSPIQGTAADLIKLAMIRVENALNQHYPQAKLLLQVHDELIFEVPADTLKETALFVKNKMQNAVKLRVPLLASAKAGKNWYELEKLAL